MAEYLSPGVYVEEYDSTPRAIEGVGTSTAGFVGMAAKGPTIGAPTLISNFAEFQRRFGGYLSEYTHGDYRFLAHSVEQFFANGGTRCYIVRVIPEDASLALAESGILKVRAANEGRWGNRIRVSVESVRSRKMQLVAKESETVYTAKSVAGFGEGDLVEFAGEVNRIVSIYDNSVTFEEPFAGDPVDVGIVPKTVVYLLEMDVSVRADNEIENYPGVSLNPLSLNYMPRRMAKSQLVALELGDEDALRDPASAILGSGATKGIITLSGGQDGSMSAVNAGVFIGQDGGPTKRTGIQAFLESPAVSIVSVPGITIPEVVVALVAHCENQKTCFAVIDMPRDMVKTNDLIEYRDMIDSTYAAMYHPWIQVYDPVARKPGFIPPSGAVCGVYARTDVARGVHKAPANEAVHCSGLSTYYTTAEQDILNPRGVNLIRALPGQGIRVWGARTASTNQAFKYVNVRRLFIYVEESIRNATNWVVFEPNNAALWGRVRMTVSSFLETMFRSGMLAGETPDQAFFVNIGTATMSQDDIMNGRLICEVGIAPSRPAEFVIFRVTQFTAEAGGGGEEAAE